VSGVVKDETGRKDSRDWLAFSPVYREGSDGSVVTMKRQQVRVVAGMFSAKLDPGVCVLENPDGQRYTVTVPDEDADLWDVIAAAVAFPPNTDAEALASAVESYLVDNPPSADWNGLANKPTVIGAGSTQSAARSAIGAASSTAVTTAQTTADTGVTNAAAAAAAAAVADGKAVAAQATANAAAPRITSGQFPWPSGLVALWDFQNDAVGGATLTSKVGAMDHVLTGLQGKLVAKDATDPGPFGPSLVLDGATCFAKGPGLGSLDVAQVGDQVTVIAWVNDSVAADVGSAGYKFRAGSHCESTTPARQYGLYFDAWGWVYSNGHLGPHIGAQDGPSTGYPFNRDQAISKRCYFTGTGQNQWHMEAMTFDGAQCIAYVDGITDIWKNAAEPPSSFFGAYSDSTYRSAVVDRNPFPFKKGLNRSSTNKYFTIGAAMSNGNAGINFTTGKLGGVAVFNRALTAAEIMQVRLMTLKSNEPISKFGLEVNRTGVNSLSETAWLGRASALCADVGTLTAAGSEYAVIRPAGGSTSYLTKTSTGIGAAWIALTGLNSSQVRKVKFDLLSAATTSAAQRLLVKVGSQWWATNTTYATTTTHSGDTDWTGAETKTIDINWDAGNWLPVTLQDSTTPTAQTFTNMVNNPSLSVNATNWFKSGSVANATAARTAVTGGFAYILTWSGTDSVTTIPVSVGGMAQAGVGAVTAGTSYSASMQVTCSKTQALYMEIQWFNASSTYLSSTFGGTVTTAAATPITLAASGVAPATATQALIRIVTPPAASGGVSWASADTLALTKCIMVANSILPAYFDGDTASASWTGTSGASTSTLSTTGLPVATNLALNPILKAASTGWFTSGAMAHATGARVLSGSEYVWRTTWTGTDTTNGASVAGCLQSSIGAITAGLSYTTSLKVTANRARRGWLQIDWYNASNALVSSTTGQIAVCGKNFPTTVTATGVAPATATQMLIRFIASGWDFVSGDTLDVGSLMVVQATSLPGVVIEGSGTYTGGTLSIGGSTNAAWIDNDLITAIGFISSGGDGSAVRVSNLALYPVGTGS